MKEFIDLVEEMRTAQDNYFRTMPGTKEKRDFLNQSRKLESRVDKMIKDLKSNQAKLF